jgi:hypothetical protein
VKLDLYRTHRAEYVAPKEPVLVRTKPAKYLAIAGRGAPSAPAFSRAIGALYAMAFTIKMARKFAGRDYVVTKLEGLWWGQRAGRLLIDEPKDRWRWKLMIRVPLLHVGPYDAEHDSIRRMHALADEQGQRVRGKHHEIYLSDPRRVPAQRLKTILRQPIG